MKSLIRWVSVVILVALLSSGCGLLEVGTDEQSAEPGSVLFSDNFSDPTSGWGVWNKDGVLVEYYKNTFRILVNEPQYDFWSVPGLEFTDVEIEVHTMKIAGPDDNDFGIICRYQNKDNFYMMVISSDGYYGIAKMKDGKYSLIGADQLQYNNAIAQKEAANHLRADCVGSTLRFYVNGVKLIETRDSDFTIGDVGLIAGTYDEKGVDILFDNFVVRKPK